MSLDTIEIHIHDCNKFRKRKFNETEKEYQKNPYQYPENHLLYLALLKEENRYIERKEELIYNEETINKNAHDLLKKVNIKRSLVYAPKVRLVSHKEETLYTKNVTGKYNISSSNYNVIFDIKSDQNTISFRLSVPKYIYNNSIAQYLPNINSKRFMQHSSIMSSISHNENILIPRLSEFIIAFIKDLSLTFDFSCDLDLSTVELKLIDLCFNQFFDSKKQALAMLDCQKKIYKKKVRKNSPTHKDEKTSLYYRNSQKTFFFKIYHKGSEFIKQGKSDYKRLSDLNTLFFKENYKKLYPELKKLHSHLNSDLQRKTSIESYLTLYLKSAKKYENISFVREFEKLMPYKLFFLLSEADKIMRYEMQFTSTYMSNIYLKNVYCKNAIDYKKLKKNHIIVQQYYNHLNKGNIDKAKHYKRRYNITLQCIKEYEAFHAFNSKTFKFFFKTNQEVKSSEASFLKFNRLYKCPQTKKNRIQSLHIATFSTELLKAMNKVFFDEIKYFQVESVSNPMSLIDKVDKHNDEVIKRKKAFIYAQGKEALKHMTRTEKIKNGLVSYNRSRFKTYFEHLENGLSLDLIRENFNLSNSTYYELKKILKDFNLNEQTIKSSFSFKDIRTDYHTFYTRLSNSKFINSLYSPNEKKLKSVDSYIFKNSAF